MKIEKREFTVGDIYEEYTHNPEDDSVRGLGGKLDIRPPYQREFVYKGEQQKEVIHTVMNNFPLNIMYWAKTPNGYEVLDGQQRTLSLMSFLDNEFSIDYLGSVHSFFSLTAEEQNQIMDYKLDVYVCDGTDREKLQWFKVVNIAGEKLTDQELRNSVYAGPWLAEAKKYFSKNQGVAYQIGHEFVKGSPIRQEFLETALKWISQREGIEIEDYMNSHQMDSDSHELEDYYETVIEWARSLFPKKDAGKKGLNWGYLYEKYHNNEYNPEELNEKLLKYKKNEEITRKSGIYEYLLSGDERHLNLRQFDKADKESRYYQVGGKCENCGRHIELKDAQADHIIRWSEGGRTEFSNLQILCRDCNLKKG